MRAKGGYSEQAEPPVSLFGKMFDCDVQDTGYSIQDTGYRIQDTLLSVAP